MNCAAFSGTDINLSDEVQKLETRLEKLIRATYAKLTGAQKVQVARHPLRPRTSDYVAGLFNRIHRRWPATAASPKIWRL